MLQPKRTKYRKLQKGRNRGLAIRGSKVSFGEFGLKSLERGQLTARQIEAARRALTRYVKRGGKIWIRIFPDKPITKKPLEVRQGKGKGNVEYWVSLIQPGRMIFEIEGVTNELAREAFRLAAGKLPLKTSFVEREVILMNTKELRERPIKELEDELQSLYKERFNLTLQKSTKQLAKPHLLNQTRKQIARVKTILRERMV